MGNFLQVIKWRLVVCELRKKDGWAFDGFHRGSMTTNSVINLDRQLSSGTMLGVSAAVPLDDEGITLVPQFLKPKLARIKAIASEPAH